MVKTCGHGKILNAATRMCVSKTSKIGVVAHNKKTVREDEVAEALDAVRGFANSSKSSNSKNASSLVARVRTLSRKHVAVTIVILAAIAAGMFGFSTDTAKAVAAKVLASVRRGTVHSKELVEDLWSRVFRGASKKKLEEMAKAAGPGKFALAFKTLWPKLLMAAAAAGSVAALAAGRPELIALAKGGLAYVPNLLHGITVAAGQLKHFHTVGVKGIGAGLDFASKVIGAKTSGMYTLIPVQIVTGAGAGAKTVYVLLDKARKMIGLAASTTLKKSARKAMIDISRPSPYNPLSKLKASDAIGRYLHML